ncbi:AAA family ATPase [Ruegeria sp.]|uniref:AAA family ATPase n=1 Tax=Ruegeria sp. TaxID=1879320 RepID=UPI003B00CF09
MPDELDKWLELHSLGHYAEAFKKQDVRVSDLPILTKNDLIEIGLPIGPRRRMLAAISQMTHPETMATKAPELRHLTLMFSDLVGSTQLSEELDIESYRDLLNDYQSLCSQAIDTHYGHLAQFQGDGVVAYFGYPKAEEDDAERAVLAGIEICRKLAKPEFQGREPMQARIGIATGNVVVEARGGHGLALSDVPNLAARIQAVAEPGTVAVSSETKDLLGRNFDCKPLGSYEFKGFSEPIGIWRVHGVNEAELRFVARQRGSLAQMVGRRSELLQLKKCWNDVRVEGTKVVSICGEAGIGKSRIVEAFNETVSTNDRLRLNFQCLPNHSGSVFFPVTQAIAQAAGIARKDTEAQSLVKLQHLLSKWTDDQKAALPVVAHFLSISLPTLPEQPSTPPEQLKEQFLEVFVAAIQRLADKKPLVLLFEDLHWVDPSSEELIGFMIEHLKSAPVLILCTYRPDYEPLWAGHANVTSITLARLGDGQSRQMLGSLAGSFSISSELQARIIAKTGGVPLFLEEMVRMVEHRLTTTNSDQAQNEALSLPSTLKDLLTALIDNLVVPRDFVSVCAAIGRTIFPEMLAAVSSLSEQVVKARLDQLTNAKVLVRHAEGEGIYYIFRHALIQDAAYELLLPSRARALHRTIADVIAQQYPEIASKTPEQLARHYSLSGTPDLARHTWKEAAERAAQQSATAEVICNLNEAISENTKIDDAIDRDSQELALRRRLNVALNTHAFGSKEVRSNRDRLNQLLNETDASLRDRFLALVVQYGSLLMLGDTTSALKLCKDMERIAELTDDLTLKAIWAHSTGMSHFMLGDFDKALGFFDVALELRNSIVSDSILEYYAADIRSVDTAMRVWAVAVQTGECLTLAKTMALVEKEPHEFSKCYALGVMAAAHQFAGNVEATRHLSEIGMKISEEREFQYWRAWCEILNGWAKARSGYPVVGADQIKVGIDNYLATGSTQMTLYARTLLADAFCVADDFESGFSTLEAIRSDPLAQSIRYQCTLIDQVETKIKNRQRRSIIAGSLDQSQQEKDGH